MMYTFPNKLRNLAIAFMVVGFLGLTYGFLTAPATIEESKAMVATHDAGHGDNHGDTSSAAHETTSAHQKIRTC